MNADKDTPNKIGRHDRYRSADAYDIIAACACGAISGLVDVFLVGSPVRDDSILEPWANDRVDSMVKRFAKATGWPTPDPDSADVAHAIDYLEKKFRVNYDQRHTGDVGGLFNMNTQNHHLKSLAHSPDICGLFFSVLNQFTSTAAFVSDGKIKIIKTDLYDIKSVELYGHDVKTKLFCGVVNWIGHIMSDIAGSSVTRRYSGDGMGVAIPFFELFQFCKFKPGASQEDLAEIAIAVFEQGYDARYGLALGIPVAIADLLTRLLWSLRRKFQFNLPIGECIPSKRFDDLRTMLLVSSGTLCLIDATDALARSGGGKNAVEFFARTNLIAWARLAYLGIQEVAIRASLERDIDAVKESRAAIANYESELKKSDIPAFVSASRFADDVAERIGDETNQEELNEALLRIYADSCGKLPWEGDFEEHMSDRNASLRFEA